MLRHVLSVSPADATVTVEPGVTMEELVAATLPHGLVPKVVPEFRKITVGGAIMGGAMESSSFAHGMFGDTVTQCEVLLPNGTVMVTSRTARAELHAALGGSYGSLATSLTAATIECVRLPTHPRAAAAPRSPTAVELTLTWHADAAEGTAALSRLARDRTREPDGRSRRRQRPLDFLDGVALPVGTSTAGGVLVCAARYAVDEDDDDAADDANLASADDAAAAGGHGAAAAATDGGILSSEVWSIAKAGDPFYYELLLEAASRLAAAAGREHGGGRRADGGNHRSSSSIRVRMGVAEYLFRHDRGAFQIGTSSLWLARWQDWITPTKLLLAAASARAPLNLRALSDPLFTTDTMYRRLHAAPPEAIASRLVLQDLFVPEARAADAIAFCRARLTQPPCALWLWPVRGAGAPGALLAPNAHVGSEELLINVGIYSRAPSGGGGGGGVAFTRALEQWGLANGCRKLLYSANHYAPDELWATDVAPHMYDRARYETLRECTGAAAPGRAANSMEQDRQQPGLAERVLSVLRTKREMSPFDAALVTVVEALL